MKDKSWKAKILFSRFPMMQLSVPSGGSRMRSNVRAAAHKRMSDIELYLRNLFSQPNEIRQVIPFAFQTLTVIFTLDVFFHRNSLLLYYCSLYGMVLIRFFREWSSSITIQEWCFNTWNFWKNVPIILSLVVHFLSKLFENFFKNHVGDVPSVFSSEKPHGRLLQEENKFV